MSRADNWLTKEQQQYLIEHYTNTFNSVLMARFGLKQRTLLRIAKDFGLSKAHRFKRKGISNAEYFGEDRWDEIKGKAVKSLKETIRMEKIRLNWGFEQKTKLKLIRQSKSKIMARYRLCKRYGYKSIDKQTFEAPAVRNLSLEQLYKEKWRFVFIDAYEDRDKKGA